MKGRPIILLQVFLIILLSRFDTIQGTWLGETTISQNLPLETLPNGYSMRPGDNVAYKMVMEDKSWYEARDSCIRDGGRLAIVDTFDKLEHMQNVIRYMQETDSFFYIGIYMPRGSRDWIRVDNQSPVSISNVPMLDLEVAPLEDRCAALYHIMGEIISLPCQDFFPSICELLIDVNKLRTTHRNTTEVYANAEGGGEAKLDILPGDDVQYKPINSKTLLTCVPHIADPTLITDIQWLDPQNRVIEPLSSTQRNTKMYSKAQPGNKLSLYFNSLQEDQAGTYSCKASYPNSKYLTRNVTIEVMVGITWEDVPTNQYPILGEDYSVKCKVKSHPSPSVDWLYNGELITTNDHYIIETHELKIKNVQESDDGIYTCRASVIMTGQLEERAIRVEVHTPPRIEESNSTVEIIEGKNASIICKAIGKPPPKFMWIKSLTQQNLAEVDGFDVDEDTGTLTITNAGHNDTGEYRCKATNVAGEATSEVKTVLAIGEPKIVEFVSRTDAVEKSVEMRCKAFGRPLPKVLFRKHTADKYFTIGVQQNDDRITFENSGNDITGETTAVLTIKNLSRTDDGLYECFAQNKIGAVFKKGYLTVEFPLSLASMKNLTYSLRDQKPVNLTCMVESIPNDTVRCPMNGREIPRGDLQIEQNRTGLVSILSVTPIDTMYYGDQEPILSDIHESDEPRSTAIPLVANLSNDFTDFVRFGVAYEIYNEYLTHAESRARCVEEGGRLAVVDSFEKNNHIVRILLTGSVHVAIPLNTTNCDNEWSRGHDNTLSATIPWAPNNPQPTRCAALRYDGSGLEDTLCSNRLQFVCEIAIVR